jgi:hypothetical protein
MFAKNVAGRSYRDAWLIARGGVGLRSDFRLILEHIYLGDRVPHHHLSWLSFLCLSYLAPATIVPGVAGRV